MSSRLVPDTSEDVVAEAHVPATSGTTLLPRPVASLVSLLTQSTSLSLRIGTFFGGFALDSARATTLTGLELSRAVIEGILTRAGRDVAIRSGDDHGRAEAESLLERSLATLHTTVTSASFFAAATFHLSSTTLSSIANFSQALLSTLDAILGSTESSRAIAAIITLIRREFRSVDDASAERIGVGDLLIGSVGFALLQRWGKKNTERHIRENGGDEIVWDVVILDNGARADPDLTEPESASFVMPGHGEEAFDAFQRRSSIADTLGGSRLSLPLDGQQQVSDEDIHSYIMSQLPQGCHASVRSEVLTARTITVDIYDDDMAEIAAPPGTTMIEERFHHDHEYAGTGLPDYQHPPRHTVVFRTAFNRSQSTQLRPHDMAIASPLESEPSLPENSLGAGQNNSLHKRAQSQPETSSNRTIKQRNNSGPESPTERPTERPTNPKTAAGKASFTRFAQRVEPAGPEKNGNTKRPPPKKPSEKSPGPSGAASARQPVKPVKGSASVKEATPREITNRPATRKKVPEAAGYRPTTPVSNRGLRRSHFPSSPQKQSPQALRNTTSRDTNDPSSSRPRYFAMREKSQESLLTHTDTFSRRGKDLRPGSPATARTHVRSSSSLSMTRSEADGTMSANDNRPSSSALHRRSQSYTPSMYSMATAGSETSLLLAHRPRKSAYDDGETIRALNRDGYVPGIFPERHFVQSIRRFCRFSSASYGSNALKVMGVPKDTKSLPASGVDRHEHSAFSHHAGLPPSTILLSSFVDPAGGSNAAGETESGFPLVHYLSLDHDSKAVVLTLRGTWGFEDILTDMTCDYDDLEWQGRSWKVHKGMHASAKRLLGGGGAPVMITLRAALEEFPDYGVVLCGHSLGGGVAALLATMISEPNTMPIGTSFVTASYQPAIDPRLLTANTDTSDASDTIPESPLAYTLPAGRPIHVYAYGPPAVMSPFLRLATRGLITTIVNGDDAVPSLSLGILHDMHTASLAFKGNESEAKSHIRQRLHERLRQSIIHKFYVNQPPLVVNAGDGVGEDAWAWKTLRLLRDDMCAPKLMPPGEVFVVDTMRVLQRDAFTPVPDSAGDAYPRLGRPATRVQMRFVRNVDAWFRELRFASGMLSDHNPVRYETGLAALARGVLNE
ncbi:FMN-dependent dehydrogenase [Penicillium alfredii]|uniref:sn-1-specific diacylglycerol lipase n=1 Tax=Penicillium alfredii TaxID=1506179 RepID=A0A9W9F2M6_9EURO|nr:FMN-dependent dehydrogenase [Penicillium alfredii]KAJ5092523.1 FMN-dependent dehydrogenase [Penicillium alfredii]